MPFTPEQMAARAAQEIDPGSIVNLGIGLPTLVANYVPEGNDIWLHSENGLLGMGPYPYEEEADPELINAGKETVTTVPGASAFDSALSFTMIRGGHVDLVILGAMQVSQTGDLANWSIPGRKTTGIGGAMDLARGARRVVAMMHHCARDGSAKLVTQCTFPLTAPQVVSRIVTDLGVFDPMGDGFTIVERAPNTSLEDVQQRTDAPVR